jgi:Fur family zinc uptake transcriptional regulator
MTVTAHRRRDGRGADDGRTGDGGPFHGEAHDHAACVGDALDRAAILCERRGARLTDLRRQVLELVWRGHAPVGAYEILGAMQSGERSAAPPTVYRALEFLMEQGLVHRIESLNAYVGCDRPERAHVSQFLICKQCGGAAELDDKSIADSVMRRAKQLGFTVERQTIEVRGLCPTCQAAA